MTVYIVPSREQIQKILLFEGKKAEDFDDMGVSEQDIMIYGSPGEVGKYMAQKMFMRINFGREVKL